MTNKQKPMIMESPLTGEFYYVNRYEDNGNGNFTALNKRKATQEEIDKYLAQVKKCRKDKSGAEKGRSM